MGGVDLFDSMIACYRIPIRKRKWWFPFYSWSLSASAVNGWRLMQRVKGYDKPFLHFLREVVKDIMAKHGAPLRHRANEQQGSQSQYVQYDGIHHWIEKLEKRGNCRYCASNGKPDRKAMYSCRKCKVTLHVDCFTLFHGQ